MASMRPTFFETPTQLRRWFEANHATTTELWIGYYKKQSGRGGVTYKQALDEALCFGWIDGVLRSLDETSYTNRFTPRRQRSTWSAVNIARAQALIAEGRMRPAGLAAFERRAENRSRVYSYQQGQPVEWSPAEKRALRANRATWTFVSSQAPSLQRGMVRWVQSAMKAETRQRRLGVLIDCASRGELPPPFIPRPGRAKD